MACNLLLSEGGIIHPNPQYEAVKKINKKFFREGFKLNH